MRSLQSMVIVVERLAVAVGLGGLLGGISGLALGDSVDGSGLILLPFFSGRAEHSL